MFKICFFVIGMCSFMMQAHAFTYTTYLMEARSTLPSLLANTNTKKIEISDEKHQGVSFHEKIFEQAKLEAASKQQKMMVKIYATWCGPCKKLSKEVFEQIEAVDWAKDMYALKLDFDAAEHQKFMKDYNILSLPTVIFIENTGVEIGRIEGFKGKGEFLKAAAPLMQGQDDLIVAKKLLMASKLGSKAHAEALLRLGKILLVRGLIADAKFTLNRLIVISATNSAYEESAQWGLFTLGRYYSRVKEDHQRGMDLWRELWTRFPKSQVAPIALYGFLKDMGFVGKVENMLFILIENRHILPPPMFEGLLIDIVIEKNFEQNVLVKLLKLHSVEQKQQESILKKLKKTKRKTK